MQRTIWLDVCARSRSVLISVLLCPRSGITRAGERVSRRSVVIPRSSEGLQRGLLAKLICNAVTRDRRIHLNAAFPLLNFPYHLWNFPRPIFLHHPLRFTSTIDFPEIFIPGRAQRWRNRCACSIGESYEYLIYDEKYNVTYCKEQNYKRIYFMDLYIYVSNIFIIRNTKNVINNKKIEKEEKLDGS